MAENYRRPHPSPRARPGVPLLPRPPNLKLDVQEGNIDVAHRTLSATDIEDLRGNDKVKVVDGPGGEIRYLVFNFNTMPFGATTAEADPAKALAVRQAIADLIDRDAISEDVYKGTFTPLYSYVPEGLTGANESLSHDTPAATPTAGPARVGATSLSFGSHLARTRRAQTSGSQPSFVVSSAARAAFARSAANAWSRS